MPLAHQTARVGARRREVADQRRTRAAGAASDTLPPQACKVFWMRSRSDSRRRGVAVGVGAVVSAGGITGGGGAAAAPSTSRAIYGAAIVSFTGVAVQAQAAGPGLEDGVADDANWCLSLVEEAMPGQLDSSGTGVEKRQDRQGTHAKRESNAGVARRRAVRSTPARRIRSSTLPWPVPADTMIRCSAALKSASDRRLRSSACPFLKRHT